MTMLDTSSPMMRIGYLISTFVRKAAFAALTCIFGIAGAIVGFSAGVVIGPTKEVGCCNGARMGAFTGAVLAVEMLQATVGRGRWSLVSPHRENIATMIVKTWPEAGPSSRTPIPVWKQTEKPKLCGGFVSIVLKLRHQTQIKISGVQVPHMEIFLSLLNGKAFQEWIGEALMAEDEAEVTFEDHLGLFEFGSAKGMQSEGVKKLPEFVISSQEKIKASAGENPCAICLQDFEEGDIARSLPRCSHHFHMICIDKWLTAHGSCPICRQQV